MIALCAGAFGWLFGCAEPPSLDDALKGEVEWVDADRGAIERLLASSDIAPSTVRVLTSDETRAAQPSSSSVHIEDGRLTRLDLSGVDDTSEVQNLRTLRELRLEGGFESLRLDGLEHLTQLTVLSTEKSLRRLGLGHLPALRSLSIHGAELPGDQDFTHLQLRSLSLTDCGLDAVPRVDGSELTELFLSSNPIGSLRVAGSFERLEVLHLSATALQSLEGLPQLPALRALFLANTPLRADVSLDGDRVPSLRRIDLRATGLRAAPMGLRDRHDLRLKFESGVAEAQELGATLERLRSLRAQAPGELVTRVGATSGKSVGSSGRCTLKTGVHRQARVTCHLSYEVVRGTVMVRLGETDPALPFKGGGAPRVAATLRVAQGEAAIYVREQHDLIATARTITGVSLEMAEAARLPGDAFKGYRRVAARPGEPARVEGDVVLFGSRIVLFVEAMGGEARGIQVVIEPAT